MIVVGIDVSKETLVGIAINRASKSVGSFTLGNNRAEIGSWLTKMCVKYKHLLVASEATAEYHRTLALECLASGVSFRLLNPIVTKQFTRSTVRKRKTDPADALTIAKLALAGEGAVVTAKSFDITKSYSRTASKLVQIEQKLHLMQLRFSSLAPEDKDSRESFEKCIDQLKQSVVDFRAQALSRVDKTQLKLLLSIPGIGKTIATTLVAEIGDISNFKSGKALVAYAGIDPRVKQSGRGLHHNTRLTKRGSPYLRQALFQAAFVARVHDDELKEYYQKKIAEGKRYKEATIATSRKLLYRVYAVLKRQTPYTR